MKKIYYLYIPLVITSIVCLIQACSSKQTTDERTKVVNELAKYSLELDNCKDQGRDAGKYSVYEECAKQVDIKFGKKEVK